MCPPLLSIDAALGRLDYHSLSDQALMEMLISGMDEEDQEYYQDGNDNFLDVCEWSVVTCTDERVTSVNVRYKEFGETQFLFRFIPPNVSHFQGEGSNLHGTLDTAELPQVLLDFNVADNELHGTLNWKGLPQKLETLMIDENNFCGSLALSDLPRSLKDFEACNNQFSGEISLNDLPPALEELWLYGNLLTGSIHIEKLPESIRNISLGGNSLSGDFCMDTFPASLSHLDVSKNAFSAKVVLKKSNRAMYFKIKIDDVSAVVDESGDKHDWHEYIVCPRSQN